jgi:HD superfamily phosphodiesterase
MTEAAKMRKDVNRKRLGPCLASQRNRRLYEKVRDTYARLAIVSHGWDHIHRCLLNAVTIAETEICSLDIVFAAALLHDIGFIGNPDPAGHHERGAAACANWLEDWSEAEQKAIRDCIYSHKGKAQGFGTIPVTVEQKIICDADLLEKVGYTGLFQSVITFAEFGATCWPQYRSLEHILRHLVSVEEIEFYTRRAREISAERGGTAERRAIQAMAVDELSVYYNLAEEAQQQASPAETMADCADSMSR